MPCAPRTCSAISTPSKKSRHTPSGPKQFRRVLLDAKSAVEVAVAAGDTELAPDNTRRDRRRLRQDVARGDGHHPRRTGHQNRTGGHEPGLRPVRLPTRNPRLHPQPRGAVRQQPSRTRPTNDQSPPKDLRRLAHRSTASKSSPRSAATSKPPENTSKTPTPPSNNSTPPDPGPYPPEQLPGLAQETACWTRSTCGGRPHNPSPAGEGSEALLRCSWHSLPPPNRMRLAAPRRRTCPST